MYHPHPPNKLISRWPEIIFDINRILRDQGRMKFLTLSIKTINEINIIGVPLGIKWINIELVNWTQPKIINLIQIGTPNLTEKIKCEEQANTYGINPKRLTPRIKKNNLINKIIPIFNFLIL